jgi:hypothetical protein
MFKKRESYRDRVYAEQGSRKHGGREKTVWSSSEQERVSYNDTGTSWFSQGIYQTLD